MHNEANDLATDLQQAQIEIEELAEENAALRADAARLRAALEAIRPLVSQALCRREMPSWRYAHYYGSDERTTDDLLHEAFAILEALTSSSASRASDSAAAVVEAQGGRSPEMDRQQAREE